MWCGLLVGALTCALTSACASTPEAAAPPQPPPPPPAVRIAVAGDSGTEGDSSRVLTSGLGDLASVLSKADVTVVNVETAIADDRAGLHAEPKQYAFLAPSAFLDVLAKAGVDAVSLANNHGLDYGREGLSRTLATARGGRPVLLGAGRDEDEAFRSSRTQVRGRGVVVLAATDVMDDGFDWAAGPDRSGLASIKTDEGYERLRAAVRTARAAHATDVILLFLHAGVELGVCPTDRQRQLGTDLAADGADAVVMSHAHVLQPYTTVGKTAVAYGLGNFVFAARSQGTSTTGVLELEFPSFGAPVPTWHPAKIERGVPRLVAEKDSAAAVSAWQQLGDAC